MIGFHTTLKMVGGGTHSNSSNLSVSKRDYVIVSNSTFFWLEYLQLGKAVPWQLTHWQWLFGMLHWQGFWRWPGFGGAQCHRPLENIWTSSGWEVADAQCFFASPAPEHLSSASALLKTLSYTICGRSHIAWTPTVSITVPFFSLNWFGSWFSSPAQD